MTRSEKLALERILIELEVEMRKVQEEIDALRGRLRDGTTRRRGSIRMCARREKARRS